MKYAPWISEKFAKSSWSITDWTNTYFCWLWRNKKVPFERLIIHDQIIQKTQEVVSDCLAKYPSANIRNDITFYQVPVDDVWWMYDKNFIWLWWIYRFSIHTIAHELVHAFSDNWKNVWFFDIDTKQWRCMNEWFTEYITRKIIMPHIPQDLHDLSKDATYEFIKKFKNANKRYHAFSAKFIKDRILPYDYRVWCIGQCNSRESKWYIGSTYDKDMDLVSHCIATLEQKNICKDELLDDFFASNHQNISAKLSNFRRQDLCSLYPYEAYFLAGDARTQNQQKIDEYIALFGRKPRNDIYV